MSKRNNDFFDKKSEWAVLKDDLLGQYLEPYLSKILTTRRRLLYVDGFAGKGMFDDGSPGSPVIACRRIDAALERNRTGNAGVTALFVEKNYAADLRVNVASFKYASVHEGSYEKLPDYLLNDSFRNDNLFLYVDPYGVKHLDMSFLARVSKLFASAEALINLNSFGLFRAACAVFNVSFDDVEDLEFLVELDPGLDDPPSKNEWKLTRACGGEYWKEIVLDYKAGVIDGYQAEERLAKEYCKRLHSSYQYVQNLPIRIREGNHPKYRMIHATNHHDGCLLMYGTMYERLVDMKLIQHGGQRQLFMSNDTGDYIDVDEEIERFKVFVSGKSEFVLLESVLAEYVSIAGLTLPLKELKQAIRGFEKSGIVEVKRYPALTGKGTPRTFMESKSGKTVEVRGKHG